MVLARSYHNTAIRLYLDLDAVRMNELVGGGLINQRTIILQSDADVLPGGIPGDSLQGQVGPSQWN